MSSIVTNFNIKQVTNYDITDDTPRIIRSILVSERVSDGHGGFDIQDTTRQVEYAEILQNIAILKFGYCCEPKGVEIPIFLQVNGGNYQEFRVSKNGMYEMQPEQYINVNDIDSVEKTTDTLITGVQIPVDMEFTFDYVISID